MTWPRKYAYSSSSIREEEPTFWTTATGGGWSMNVGGHAEEKPELFNLREDPAQERNVYRKHRDVARKMGRAYVQFLQSVGCESGKVALMAKKFQ